MEDVVKEAAEVITNSNKTVVFTGAGASTESGVPDFRSPGGIWDQFDPDSMTYQNFLSSSELRKDYWQFYRQCWDTFRGVEPNPTHRCIAKLQTDGYVDIVITQNVDGLHAEAGSPREQILRIHGTMWRVRCLDCRDEYDYSVAYEQLQGEYSEPHCPSCDGLLKPATVAFGQPLPQEVFQKAEHHTIQSDLFISIGSSLTVYPAAVLPKKAKYSGAKVLLINKTPTALDELADLIITGLAGELLSDIVKVIYK